MWDFLICQAVKIQCDEADQTFFAVCSKLDRTSLQSIPLTARLAFPTSRVFKWLNFSSRLKLLLCIVERTVHSIHANSLDYCQIHGVLILVNFCYCYWLMVLNRRHHCRPLETWMCLKMSFNRGRIVCLFLSK